MSLKALLLLDQVQAVQTHKLPDLFSRLEGYTGQLVEKSMACCVGDAGGVHAALEAVSDAFAMFRDTQEESSDLEACVAFLSQLQATCVELAERRLSDRA